MARGRRLPRGSRLIWMGIGFCAIVVLLFWYGLSIWSFPHRTTIALIANPISIISFDPENRDVTTISLSPDQATQAVNGYGTYTLSALWRLGSLEKSGGKILTESLGEVVGLPVSMYAGPASEALPVVTNPADLFASYTVVRQVLTRELKTDISILTLLLFTRAIRSVPPQNIRVVDLTSASVTKNESLPDESERKVLDPGKIDTKLAHLFESPRIRGEDIRLSVVNTTSVSGLAERASRTMGNLGMIVTNIETDEPPIDTCEIVAKTSVSNTYTIRRLAQLFDCRTTDVAELERVEALVRIGNNYARKFLPINK